MKNFTLLLTMMLLTSISFGQMASIQVIHNSPDQQAEMVDVYLDGTLIKDNFMFREATPFLEVPAEQDILVQVAPSTSESSNDAIASFTYNLEADGIYILVANGMLNLESNYTITNEGLTFVPETLVATVGDEITFDVGSMHPVVEVSKETWDVNGTSPLEGGFSAPNGTETIAFDEPGTFYYICENHIGSGMKGKITVTSNTFNIDVYSMGQQSALETGNTDILVNHGSIDAPTVDLFETGVGAGQVFDNLSYGGFTGYLALPTNDYIIDIKDETGMQSVAMFSAPLETLGLSDQAIVLVASGFLNPVNFNSETNFGLYAATTSGGMMVELPAHNPGTAMVQIIHNSADAAAEMVDVYLDGALIKDDFMFREATPFLEVPADQEIVVDIAPSTSESANDAIATFTYNLADGGKYIIIANGIVSESGYEPMETFDLYVYDMAQMESMEDGNTDVLVFHGSTDAPTVDVDETMVVNGNIIDDMSYGEFAGYLELPTADYVLAVKDETGEVTVAQYQAPLQTLGLTGSAITVVASGFLAPENNSNGEAFGLYVATSEGGMLTMLPSYTGIFDSKQTINATLYPNPVLDQITIESDEPIEKVIIYNSVGQIVSSKSAKNQKKINFHIDNLSFGTYIARILTEHHVAVKKFSKQ